MTFQHMQELVKMNFAETPLTMIQSLLNSAYKEFAHDSRILTYREDIYNNSSQVTYTFTTGTDFTYPVDQIIRVECLSSANEPVDEPPQFVIEDGQLRFYSYNGEVLTSMPSDVAKIYVRYSYIPADLSTDISSPAIPTEYHQAIVDRVLQQLNAARGNYTGAQYHQGEYYKLFIKAAQRANMKSNRTTSDIKPDFY